MTTPDQSCPTRRANSRPYRERSANRVEMLRASDPGSGALLRCALLFRPSAFLCCGDPCPCFRAQSALLSGQLWLRRRISTREDGAGLLEAGDFGINLSNQLGCIHAGQCKPITCLDYCTGSGSGCGEWICWAIFVVLAGSPTTLQHFHELRRTWQGSQIAEDSQPMAAVATTSLSELLP